MADRDSRIGRARSLGLPPVNRRDKLDDKDLDDLFSVNLLGRSSLDLNLSGMKKANFDVEVYAFKRPVNQIPKKIRNLDFRSLKARVRNQYLQLVGASRRKGSRNEIIQRDLDAGQYLVRVYRRKGNSRYVLRMNSTAIVEPAPIPVPVPVPVPAPAPAPSPGVPSPSPSPSPGVPSPSPSPGVPSPSPSPSPGVPSPSPSPGVPSPSPAPTPVPPGNSFETAFTGTLSPTTPLAGTVRDTDKVDYYQVTVGRGDYKFSTSGLQGKADIEIFNSSRSKIASFTSNASHPNENFLQGFDAGTYFIKFTQRTAGSTANYTVTAQKQTDGVPNTVPSTPSLPSLPTTLTKLASNYVLDGGKDSPIDYYRFEVKKRGFLTVELRNMFGNLDVEVQYLNPNGGVIRSRIYNGPSESPLGTYGEGSEVFGGTFEEGEYVLKVFTPAGSKIGSTYDLFASLDPTGVNPSIVQDTNFGPGGSQAKNIVEVGGFAFFTANDGQKTALYRSNGTLVGTRKIREFNSIGDVAIAAGDSLYFVADDGSTGNELWRSTIDGSVNLVANLAGPNRGSSINQIAAVGDTVYFVANPGDGNRLYRTIGVGADVISGIAGESVESMTAMGDQALFFVADDGNVFDKELWRIKPGETTASKIDLNINDSSDPTNITVVGANTLYVIANRNGSRRLLKLDDVLNADTSGAGIIRTNIGLGAVERFSTSTPAQMALVKNATADNKDVLYLVAEAKDIDNGDELLGQELLRLVDPLNADGNSTIELVKDIRPSENGVNLGSDPMNLVAFGNKLYFTADDGTGSKLWCSDERTGETNSIDIGNGQAYAPTRLTVVGNTLFLVANDGSSGVELWKTTGTTLNLVQDLNPNGNSDPQNLVKIGDNALFFIANNGMDGLEVWSVGTGGV